jgi:hypothetical protein
MSIGPGAIIGGFGAALAISSTLQSGKRQRRLHDHNALLEERDAVIARQQALADAGTSRRDASRKIGAMRAAYGASGIVSNDGSAMDVLESSAAEAELDALTIIYKGELRAMGHEDTAYLERERGQNAVKESRDKAMVMLFQSGSQMYSQMSKGPTSGGGSAGT